MSQNTYSVEAVQREFNSIDPACLEARGTTGNDRNSRTIYRWYSTVAKREFVVIGVVSTTGFDQTQKRTSTFQIKFEN